MPKQKSEWECWRFPDLDRARIYFHDREKGRCTVINVEGNAEFAKALTLLLQSSGAYVS